jgi:hypothetical protein
MQPNVFVVWPYLKIVQIVSRTVVKFCGTYLRRDVLLYLHFFVTHFDLHNLTRREFLSLLNLLCKIVDGEILQTKAVWRQTQAEGC